MIQCLHQNEIGLDENKWKIKSYRAMHNQEGLPRTCPLLIDCEKIHKSEQSKAIQSLSQ